MAVKATKPDYPKRTDNRGWDDFRPMSAKVGIVPRADGSAMFKIGNTCAYAAVYGPRNLHPKFMQDPEKGILRCHYSMMPFSGHGERVRPGTSRRSNEINMLIKNALLPVLDLKEYPNAVVDVFINLPETDAGTRCAGICAAAMALADAGLVMKDLVSAFSMGFYKGQIMTDINGCEDCEIGVADIPFAYIPTMDRFSLLQLDGEVPQEEFVRIMEMVKKKADEVYTIQKNALKARYGVEK